MIRPAPSELQTILNFTAHFMSEKSPRALIIVGAARIEEELKAIAARIEPGADDDRKSHTTRIKLLTTADVLSENAAGCLRELAKIRNHFAHTSADVALDDADVTPHVAALFEHMERRTKLADSTQNFFSNSQIATVPTHQRLPTWVSPDWQKIQMAIVFLLYHLTVLRYNLPTRRKPIEIGTYDFA